MKLSKGSTFLRQMSSFPKSFLLYLLVFAPIFVLYLGSYNTQISSQRNKLDEFSSEHLLHLQKQFGPLRMAYLKQGSSKCKPFSMLFPKPGLKITWNMNIWDEMLRNSTEFKWKYPYEEGVATDIIMRECSPNTDKIQKKIPLVIDAGANMGYFSLLAAGCGCNAVAYEPNGQCQQFIGASIFMNEFSSNIWRRQVAVTDADKFVSFNGWKTSEAKLKSSSGFDGVRLDSELLRLTSSYSFLYLKVDIQGSENDALRGAETLLKHQMIKYVAFEAQIGQELKSSEDAFDIICRNRYSCIDVQNPRELIDCERGLASYRATQLPNCDAKCERYLLCSGDSNALNMISNGLLKGDR